MTTITLKNIPEQLYRQIKQRAAQHYRSINSEVIACLQSVVASKQVDPDLLVERARSLRRGISGRLTNRDLSSLKNQGRP